MILSHYDRQVMYTYFTYYWYILLPTYTYYFVKQYHANKWQLLGKVPVYG